MPRIRKSKFNVDTVAVTPRSRAKLLAIAQEQVATSMHIEGKSFPSVDASRAVSDPVGHHRPSA